MEGGSEGQPGGDGSPLGLIGVGVIALAVVGAGAYWLFGRQAEPGPEAVAVSESPVDEPEPPQVVAPPVESLEPSEAEPPFVGKAAPLPDEEAEPEAEAPPPAEAAGSIKGKVLVIDEKEGPMLVPVDALTSLPSPQDLAPADQQKLIEVANARLDWPLTDRELEILQLITDGLTNPEIAEKLYIAEGTVKKHISSIYSKLEVKHRAEAIAKAQELGLVL